MKERKNKQPASHPWMQEGRRRLEWRKNIRRNIAETIAAMRPKRG